ncbi:MAG: pitrilysin family protein [Candidatus Egerieousia sp.]|nr:pitrilysin family protein [bacterium]MDY5254884.1 pitrilysin family protein [Candidatus Egerieousia sp.]
MKFSFKRVSSPVAVCAVSTMVGTRNEEPAYNGLAHLNEHMLFKGTEKRGAASINNLLENVGGELNAYTTKEETVVHATVLKEDLRRAVELLLELLFTSTYPDKELLKEREVVYEEIISYKDSPADSIYEDFECRLFEGHPLQYPILGTRKTLSRIESSTLKEYLHKWFIPDNMAISVVADMEESQVVKIVERALSKYCPGQHCDIIRESTLQPLVAGTAGFGTAGGCTAPGGGTSCGGTAGGRTAAGEAAPLDWTPVPPFRIEINKKHHQAHCIIGTRAYSYTQERERLALALLANILGGPAMNARLNTVLREKNALVYTVEACFNPYSDTGLFTIYFGCDKPLVERSLRLVRKELERVIEAPLSFRALANAKKQLLGQLSIASDNSEAQCLSMGKSMMIFGYIEPMETTRSKIESLTAAELQRVAQEILAWDNLSILIYK